MRVIKIVCMALIIALIAACFLLGVCAITLELWGGGTLFAAESTPAAADRRASNLDDVHAASCRVVCSKPGSRVGSIGTGTVVLRAEGKYWVLTNWHVVDGCTVFKLQFFRDGRIVEAAATLEKSWHNERAPWDFAVLTVPEAKLAQYNPPIVPLAGPEVKPLTDRPIYSSGCSEGRWAAAWKGSIESYYGNTAQFYPAPKSGQSGSAIVQELDDGLRVTGILTWRVGDERSIGEEQMRGGAIPIAHFYDAASGRQRTTDGESIPPHATWCTDSTITPAIPGGNAPVLEWPVQSATAYFDGPAASYDDLEMFFFVGPSCPACTQVKPIVNKLVKEGYKITTVDATTDQGKKMAAECKIRLWPTFVLCRDTGDRYIGLERWSGSDSAQYRIKHAFAKHAGRNLPPAPKATVATIDPDPKEVARQKRKDKKIDTPDESTIPDAAPADANNNGIGSGDISPLLGGYGQGTPAHPQQPLDAVPQKPTTPTTPDNNPGNSGLLKKHKSPTPQQDGTESGLIDKITAPLTNKLDTMIDGLEQKAADKLDSLTADLSAKAETIARDKIDELTPGIMEQVKLFAWSIVWRAAIIIAIVWFGYYLMLRLLGMCGGIVYAFVAAVAANMPTIKIERPAKQQNIQNKE